MVAVDSARPLASPVVPSIRRRLACLPYEGLLLLALLLIAAFPVAGLKGITLHGLPHLLFQAYLAAVVGSYFVWFWCHGGQTLPMKTWRFRVQRADGAPVQLSRALLRLLLSALFFGPACVGMVLLFFPARISPALAVWTFVPLCATLLWAAFDTDRQFLHDRLASTRLVSA